MRRQFTAAVLALSLLTPCARGAGLTLNGSALEVGETPVRDGITYVSLRGVAQALRPEAEICWEEDRAAVRDGALELTAVPGERLMRCNGAETALPGPVLLEQGRTLVPVRSLAALLGAETTWSPATGTVTLTTAGEEDSGDLYWLSRIISAESQGESWEGKVAVGNVVLNRVRSPQFPNTIYDVIFDPRWGGQFEPVRNGTVYNTPTPESVRAAAACLQGAETAGDSLYFLAPTLTDNHWTMENRTYVTTIGTHWFYR